MTPTQQGKFCSACSKQVIDFSLMSDNQILNFLSNQSGKLCGRFDAEQLQRPLIETKIKKKKSWWMALTMPLLFLFERSGAQDEVYVNTDSIVNTKAVKNSLQLDPLDLEYYPAKQITITGKVVDENNQPIASATIMQKGTKHATLSDTAGFFSMNIDANVDSVVIEASFIGYETMEKVIRTEGSIANIKMKMHAVSMGDVVVVGYAVRYKPNKRIDTVTTAIKKMLNNSIHKIYPNPVLNSSMLNIQIKNTGSYQMQLLDNQSRLVQAEEVNTDADNATTQIQLLSNIAAGIYYLHLINEQTKKSYTEKLIIQ